MSVSEWAEANLGELVAVDLEPVDVAEDVEYPIVGVLNRGRGLLHRDPIRGADTAYRTLNVVRANRIIYSRLKAFEGAITVTPPDMITAYASPEFPTFQCRPGLLPAYFALLTTTPSLWRQLQNLSTGMGGRRERVKPSAFLTIPIRLPEMSEQRRIVAVVATVDAHIEALGAEAIAMGPFLDALRQSLLELPDAELVALSSVTSKIGSGATPRGGESSYVSQGIALVRSQNVYDGRFEWDGLAHLTDKQAGLLDGVAVESGDVLMNITGASVNRVCVIPDTALPARVNQHVAILRTNPEFLRSRFLAHILRRPDLKQQLDQLAGAGTTRQALTKLQLQEFLIPLPDVATQERLAARLDAVALYRSAVTAELEAIRRVRANLVNALLSQEITINEAVDQFVEPAA